MKVSVTIPDALFAEAESLVQLFETSRSDLYSRALHAFIGQHAPDRITERTNAAVDGSNETTDRFTAAAVQRIFKSTAW